MIISPSVMAVFYNQPTPVLDELSPPHLKSYRRMRQEVLQESPEARDQCGSTARIGTTVIPGARTFGLDALQLPGTGSVIPPAKPYVTQYLAADEQVNEEVIQIIAAATYEWLLHERQRKQQQVQQRDAKRQAEGGPENIRYALEQHPDAMAPEDIDEHYTVICSERRPQPQENVLQVISSPPATPSVAASFAASSVSKTPSEMTFDEKCAAADRISGDDSAAKDRYLGSRQRSTRELSTPAGSKRSHSRAPGSGHVTRKRVHREAPATATQPGPSPSTSTAPTQARPITPDIIGPSDDDMQALEVLDPPHTKP